MEGVCKTQESLKIHSRSRFHLWEPAPTGEILPIFLSKALLEHSHTHSLIHYLRLLLSPSYRFGWLGQGP